MATTREERSRIEVHNPSKLPPQAVHRDDRRARDRGDDHHSRRTTSGNIFKLCDERRGVQKKMQYLSKTRVLLEYELPLGEVVLDFYDKLKSAPGATPRSTTSWPGTARARWSSSTCWSTAMRSTRCR